MGKRRVSIGFSRIEQPAVDGNYPILGTPYTRRISPSSRLPKATPSPPNPPNPYHDKIDFTSLERRSTIDSIVELFSSLGFRFHQTATLLRRALTQTISPSTTGPTLKPGRTPLPKTRRLIWLTVSWQLSQDYASSGNSGRMRAALTTIVGVRKAAVPPGPTGRASGYDEYGRRGLGA